MIQNKNIRTVTPLGKKVTTEPAETNLLSQSEPKHETTNKHHDQPYSRTLKILNDESDEKIYLQVDGTQHIINRFQTITQQPCGLRFTTTHMSTITIERPGLPLVGLGSKGMYHYVLTTTKTLIFSNSSGIFLIITSVNCIICMPNGSLFFGKLRNVAEMFDILGELT